jgi:hypothetical protein
MPEAKPSTGYLFPPLEGYPAPLLDNLGIWSYTKSPLRGLGVGQTALKIGWSPYESRYLLPNLLT